jgi:hypothetical protein
VSMGDSRCRRFAFVADPQGATKKSRLTAKANAASVVRRRSTKQPQLWPLVPPRHVLALGISGVRQTLTKCPQKIRGVRREQPDYRHRRLLRARRQPPRCRRAAEQCHELSALHRSPFVARPADQCGALGLKIMTRVGGPSASSGFCERKGSTSRYGRRAVALRDFNRANVSPWGQNPNPSSTPAFPLPPAADMPAAFAWSA